MQLNVIADALQCGRLQIASKDELGRILGYPPSGVSPFGVPCVVCVDNEILAFETILVGGGEVGVEIELEPKALIKAVSAKIFSFTTAA